MKWVLDLKEFPEKGLAAKPVDESSVIHINPPPAIPTNYYWWTTDFTISFWTYTNISSSYNSVILFQRNNELVYAPIQIDVYKNHFTLSIRSNTGAGNSYADEKLTADGLIADTWHHIAVTQRAKYGSYYRNFVGMIDDLRITIGTSRYENSNSVSNTPSAQMPNQ